MKTLPKRILGIDYGMARIGLALSDTSKILASPLTILSAEDKMEKTVNSLAAYLQQKQVADQFEIEEIVVGFPLLMSGKAGLLADEVNHFIDLLGKTIQIPIKKWDERLSTVQAERSLREGQLSRKKRSKVVDTVSAVIILQSYLDFRSNTNDKLTP